MGWEEYSRDLFLFPPLFPKRFLKITMSAKEKNAKVNENKKIKL